MIVIKFGGTSVGDADAVRRAAAIVAERLDRRPVVVVSALGGVTSALIAMAHQAARGQIIGAIRCVEGLRERHLQAVGSLLSGRAQTQVAEELGGIFDELEKLAHALSVLAHLTPRSLDTIAAAGERASTLLVAAAFREASVPSRHVDARSVMITDDAFTAATPRPDAIADAGRRILLPILAGREVPVLGGYIGATADGITTTLGRGGSDYSASLIGAGLHAEAIEIWTDVDGMLTADPRIVPEALPIEVIRFEEASELASFGAKVLHPSTIAPAVRAGIPVYVRNSRRPALPGTRISFEAPRRAVTAIAGKRDISLVKVRTTRMLLAHGFLRAFFDIFERHRTSVDVVATSEISVSVTVDDPTRLDPLLVDLRSLGDVSIERNRAVLAVVGAGIGEDTSAMARVLAALSGVRIHMVSLSATGINMTVVVDDDAMHAGMQRLHAEFFGRGAA